VPGVGSAGCSPSMPRRITPPGPTGGGSNLFGGMPPLVGGALIAGVESKVQSSFLLSWDLQQYTFPNSSVQLVTEHKLCGPQEAQSLPSPCCLGSAEAIGMENPIGAKLATMAAIRWNLNLDLAFMLFPLLLLVGSPLPFTNQHSLSLPVRELVAVPRCTQLHTCPHQCLNHDVLSFEFGLGPFRVRCLGPQPNRPITVVMLCRCTRYSHPSRRIGGGIRRRPQDSPGR
jgi:hypothetical protein